MSLMNVNQIISSLKGKKNDAGIASVLTLLTSDFHTSSVILNYPQFQQSIIYYDLKFKSVRKAIRRQDDKLNIFQHDKRKIKKMSTAAILLIEHLTEVSNGFMTAHSITKRINHVLGINVSSKRVAYYRHTHLSNIRNYLQQFY